MPKTSTDTARPELPTKRATITRADGRQLRRMTVYLPPDLARKLAVRCVELDVTISDVLAAAAQAWLGGK